MARLQISVLSCYPTVTLRGKANLTVCAFFGFSLLGGLGFQMGQITITLTFLVGVGGRLKCLPQGASDVVTPLVQSNRNEVDWAELLVRSHATQLN